eukprot:1160966-Pelagomonas_calceolata.AAC.10
MGGHQGWPIPYIYSGLVHHKAANLLPKLPHLCVWMVGYPSCLICVWYGWLANSKRCPLGIGLLGQQARAL